MYYTKLLGLALSALLPFTPVNYDWDLWQFPQTRQLFVKWYTYYNVSDIGYYDSPTGVNVNTIDEEDATHLYLISYTHDIYCSETCFVAHAATQGQPYSSNHYTIHAEDRYQGKASDLFPLLQITFSGQNVKQYEFTSASDTTSVPVVIPRFSNTLYQYDIYFKGATDSLMLDDIANHTLNASSYLLRLTLNNMLNNRTIPSDVMQQYKTYIDNGDYSTAYTYINNYINEQTVNENNETTNETNNYETQHTDLINNFNIENNFANQVETDFTNQQQNIPLSETTNNFQNQNFVKSAEWVTLRFNDMFQNSPYGKLLVFSLITGFILALIGRFKR